MQEFTRNPAIESAAVTVLHYTPDPVKRKTIASLQKELNETISLSPSMNSTPSSLPNVNSRSLTSTRRKHVSFSPSNDDKEDVEELKDMLARQEKIQQIINNDPDFDQEDRRDWEQNITLTTKKIERLVRKKQEAVEREKQEKSALTKWRRKQDKLKELEDTGLIDPSIARKWADKQEELAKRISSLQ